jgi:hypothetical protein
MDLQDTDARQFVRLLQDGGMWGGSGSVWEVGQLGTDTITFREAIIRLADEMDTAGLSCKGSQFAAQIFRKWNEAGL